MFKKFLLWFICFGLSFLVSDVFGWTEQGKAFLGIHLGVSVVIILVTVVILLISGVKLGISYKTSGISFLVVILAAGEIAISLIATYVATKLFGVNFYVVYQIMTFGQCLCNTHENKK